MKKTAVRSGKLQHAAAVALAWFFAVMVCLTVISRAAASFTVPRVVTESPVYQPLGHTVSADGILAVKQETAVVTQPDLLIRTIFVSAGQLVSAGQAIAEVDMEQLQEKISLLEEEISAAKKFRQDEEKRTETERRRAEEDYKTAAAHMQKETEKAKEALREAEEAYISYQNMLGQREPTEEEYLQSVQLLEDKKAKQDAYEQALYDQETALRTAKRAIEDAAEENNTGSSTTLSELQLERLKVLKEAGGKIIAKKGGMVTEVYGQTGQKTTDTAFCMIADLESGLTFTAVVAKEEAGILSTGGTVTLKQNGQSIDGLSVSAMKTEEDGSVTVTVDVSGTDWLPGGSASMKADFLTSDRGITVPIAAVHMDNNTDFVYVVQEEQTILGKQKKAVRINITVLEKNSSIVMVEPGVLSLEDIVITDCDRMVEDGSRVRLWEK